MSCAITLPKVSESLRTSSAKSIRRPVIGRIILPMYGLHWKWKPRKVPLREKLSLHWTNSALISASSSPLRKVSVK